jgi:1-acyl-sn-glycerol-3-phosphate acyltransferase
VTIYKVAQFVVATTVRTLFGFRVIDAQKVPLDGGVIVAGNHISNLDPPILGCATPRPLWYMAKKELFAIPLLGPLIKRLNAFPVDRQAGGTAAVRASLRMLKEGRCVCVFPEGGRNVGGDKETKAGVAFLAAASGAPVVPAAIVGTGRLRLFHPITVVFGDPLHVVRNRQAESDALEKGAAEIMDRIRALQERVR